MVVGVNCTPSRDFQIHSGNAATNLFITNNTTGATDGNGFLIQQDGNNAYVWNKESGFINFGTSATPQATLTSGGLFLVGSQTQSSAAANSKDLIGVWNYRK